MTAKRTQPAPGRLAGSQGGTRRVTLRDVAAAAGVSVTAASFVLNDRDDQRISPATKQKVRRAADALGYRPDLTARILRTGTSGTVALISDFISTTGYAAGVVRGALDAARARGSLIYIAETLGDPGVEQQLLQGMLDRRVDGFVYASMFTHHVQIPELLHGTSLVLLNCLSDDVTAPSVIPDEAGAGATAAEALLQAGHRKGIYFLGDAAPEHQGSQRWGRAGEGVPLALQLRLKGVRSELRRHHARLAGSLTVGDWEPADGRNAVQAALLAGADIRALICANDRLAMGAYQGLTAAGLRIPDDVSVVSFDDSDLARWLQPTLTSVALPHEELGKLAVDALLDPDTRPDRRRLVQMPRSDRDSIGAPR